MNFLRSIVFGILYTLTIMITMWDWAFFISYGVLEITLTLLVVWYAWTLPRQEA